MAMYSSWGNYPKVVQTFQRPKWLHQTPSLLQGIKPNYLPRGNGRSYGDSCLNDKGVLVDTRNYDNFIEFNPETGVLSAEAGVLLSDILALVVPQGWFLSVTPGTRFVTLGGAIANDVHGKNHHIRGCFSDHLISFELLRSDGTLLVCSQSDNSNWFRASVGGLGLTGLIIRASIQLMQVSNTNIATETIKMSNIDDFFMLNQESGKNYEYTVSWIDCLAKGASRGRGHFIRGNHAATTPNRPSSNKSSLLNVPFKLPVSAINPISLRVFNTLYYHKQQATRKQGLQSRDSFFYPLDGIQNWNRLYGRNGFLQYQCVVPNNNAKALVDELLDKIAASGQGSFLVVLKAFGNKPQNGIISFAREGITLAMDFPFLGDKTFKLLQSLDDTTVAANGAVYPAKDARMSPSHFKKFFPDWQELLPFKDPKISSSFWRRVTEENQ